MDAVGISLLHRQSFRPLQAQHQQDWAFALCSCPFKAFRLGVLPSHHPGCPVSGRHTLDGLPALGRSSAVLDEQDYLGDFRHIRIDEESGQRLSPHEMSAGTSRPASGWTLRCKSRWRTHHGSHPSRPASALGAALQPAAEPVSGYIAASGQGISIVFLAYLTRKISVLNSEISVLNSEISVLNSEN